MDLGDLDVDGLLEHVDVDPARNVDEAKRRAAVVDDRLTLARLHWAIGLCDRETGELESARQALAAAVEYADGIRGCRRTSSPASRSSWDDSAT